MVNYPHFYDLILHWYDANARILPWRIPPESTKAGFKPDPYKVWISEVMLQQTGVKTVGPYFLEFINSWPDVFSLAQAEEKDVLTKWAGLGYYSRARNLKACATIVCEKYNGQFPQDEEKLLKLPGIGRYTSAAIASIAFGKPSVVVDGNIERIIARLFNMNKPLDRIKTDIHAKMKLMSSRERPGDFAQGMMDLGSIICKPKTPACEICPVESLCRAKYLGIAPLLPKKKPKKKKLLRKGYVYLAISKQNQLALITRPKNGLLGGMTSPPTSEWSLNDFPKIMPPLSGNWVRLKDNVNHAFTHFNLELRVMVFYGAKIPSHFDLQPFNEKLINDLPSVMRKAVSNALEHKINLEKNINRGFPL